MKVVVVGTNQKDRERVAKVIKNKYGGLAEENADLLKKLQRSNDAWIRGREEIAALKELATNLAMENKEAALRIATLAEQIRLLRRALSNYNPSHNLLMPEEVLRGKKEGLPDRA